MKRKIIYITILLASFYSFPAFFKYTYTEPPLSKKEKAYLSKLDQAVKQKPNDFETLTEAGYTYMFLTLAGYLSLLDQSEKYLEAAFRINPRDKDLTRNLGRFYNIRMVELDFSKADMQVKVYGAHLEGKKVEELDKMEFVSWTFFQMARAIQFAEEKKIIRALRTITVLENNIAVRVKLDPKNVEFHALGGNFAFFLAGNVPFFRMSRVRRGIKYFEYVKTNWEDMRPEAGNTSMCPNTYFNFMFELADAYIIDNQKEKARTLYQELTVIKEPVTRPKEIMAAAAKERIMNLDQYKGELKLMPPWPSDMGNCIVCHSWNADIPMKSFFSKKRFDIKKIPSKAEKNPLLDF